MVRTNALVCLALLSGSVDGAEPKTNHPLAPVLRFAENAFERFDSQVEDYSCTLVKRERVDGRLLVRQFLRLKLRHERFPNQGQVTPFGVYLKFLHPTKLEGREVVYVRGRNRGRLIARNGGPQFPFITMALAPDSSRAMKGNRYPVTEIGIKHLMKELLTIGKADLKYGECNVQYFEGTEINGRSCTAVRITHPVRRDHFKYHVAEIFVDDELQLPVRYAAYDWPRKKGGRPVLVEEYTYLDLQMNVGLTDKDFDHRNPDYGFRKDYEP